MSMSGTEPKSEAVMDALVALCKRRGFIFQGSEIYGGLAGTWDYGPYGVALKNNVKNLWWKRFVLDRDDMYGMDAAILMNQRTWEASGHVGGFSDPLVKCEACEQSFRADQVQTVSREDVMNSKSASKFRKLAAEEGSAGFWRCERCGHVNLSNVKKFNMMFKTHVGASDDSSSVSYLRPETAQGMFVNFKNVIDSFHPKLPFGMAQIGKAFRNEIAPRDFLFRSREFEQMEIEYFVDPKDWKKAFEHFVGEVKAFIADVGLNLKKVHESEIPDGERAHYSKRTVDFEFDYPFGRKELYGLAYRTDFDLKQHSDFSKVDLSYYDEDKKERFIPHTIEPSFGVDRTVLVILCDAYTEDEMGGEKRVFLKLAPSVAPVKVAVFPLLKNKPELVKKAREIYAMLKKEFGAVEFDDNGNIGKRYRRQDEIGTPSCVTIDFDTIEKSAGVTVRDRDTGKQERVAIAELAKYLKSRI
jgi:glycyl-tRNA synthetase